MSSNTYFQYYGINQQRREQQNGHKALLIWYTGLSGSGKSTLANAVEQELFEDGIHTYTLDGDNIRKGINKNLTFSREDRLENLRRIAEIAKLMVETGLVVNAAFISPLISDREMVKEIVGAEQFIEVYVATSLEECERRDVKGLYQKARNGEIPDFTGISAPYEPPKQPDVVIDTQGKDIASCAEEIRLFINTKINTHA